MSRKHPERKTWVVRVWNSDTSKHEMDGGPLRRILKSETVGKQGNMERTNLQWHHKETEGVLGQALLVRSLRSKEKRVEQQTHLYRFTGICSEIYGERYAPALRRGKRDPTRGGRKIEGS